LFERYKFRHIPKDLCLGFAVRQRVIRRAWWRLRQKGMAFAVYMIVVLGFLAVGIVAARFNVWLLLIVLVLGGLYAFMEERLLRSCVDAELRHQTDPAGVVGSDLPSDQ
jgi:hypothetical protein